MSDPTRPGLPPIPRRDFVFGVIGAAGLAALGGCSGETAEATAPAPVPYPPELTGLRGSTDAVMNAAHPVRDGAWSAGKLTVPASDESFDLIVVGGGISGLTAAHLFRVAQPNARILILENHDDFGGHARRNEFMVDGRQLISYGGVEFFDHPGQYSAAAKGVLATLGIVPSQIAESFDTELYAKFALTEALYVKGAEYGGDKLVTHYGIAPWPELATSLPIPLQAQRDLVRLYTGTRNYLPALSGTKLLAYLGKTSYRAYLERNVRLHAAAVQLMQTKTAPYFGVGIDAVSALDCAAFGHPGFSGLKLPSLANSPLLGRTPRLHLSQDEEHSERYHFPDGGATLARLLVHNLIPNAATAGVGNTLQTTRANYAQLDQRANQVRLRLNSTVVHVAHENAAARRQVHVTYLQEGRLRTATASSVVLACWHSVIARICPELSAPQQVALMYGVKVPLLYTNVALRNWRSFAKAGISSVECPNQFYSSFKLDFPVSSGGYQFARTPDDPIVVNLTATPCQPGLSARDQYRAGRTKLLAMSLGAIEREARDLLTAVLGPFGFDATRDIAAITANRWAHGYAYEYNYLWDPVWAPGESPAEKARQPFGRIAIANSDGGAWAYMDGAVDQAQQAVEYLLRKA